MCMTLSELLQKREIEKIEPDKNTAKKLLKVSEDNLIAAKDNLKMNHSDVALSLAYNSMLNSARALMSAKGYRAYSLNHHKIAVSFCVAILSVQSSKLLSLFNRYRIRRHDIVYGEIESGSVAESEASDAISKAGEFLNLIKSKIS